jgi:UDP-N-acetylglucosamine:LPS N-acetylglucosamine transferase
MELTATGRPFIYVPLRQHFEQHFHVHHRLQGYGAGRRLDFPDANPDTLAATIAAEMSRPIDYLPVERNGAAHAAAAIAALL